MKYRKFGSLEWKSSILGLGTAGPPFRKGLPDASESIELIRYAIDLGVNYLDLGYPFDLRLQEHVARTVGKALEDGYRQKIRIAVTLPSHLIQSTADFDLYLDRQRSWLKADRIDFCLFGRLNRETWPVLQGIGALNWADAAIADRRIHAIGFSFHDHFQILKQLLAAYDRWTLGQFQFSYMDVDHDPGISGIKYAAGKGLAVVVTEPLKSGRLAKIPPPAVARLWSESGLLEALTEFALRFVWNYCEIATVLLDVRRLHEMEKAMLLADRAHPDGLTIQEEILISRARDEYFKLRQIDCSSCRPCMPCPEGIDVPRIFELYNDAFIYEDAETARAIFRSELHNIGHCTRCGCCEEQCVKKLPIIEWLDHARRLLF